MKNSKKYIILLFLIAAFCQKSFSQATINITFQNRHLAKDTVWTFDIYAAAGTNYGTVGYTNWAGATIKFDIAVGAGITIGSASGTGNAAYMDATGVGVQLSVAGTPPVGSVEMGVSLLRNSGADIPGVAVRIASITVNFRGGLMTGNEVITPRTALTSSGSYWTNTDQGSIKQAFSQPTNFTLPITLVSFTAAKAGTDVNLNWLVSSETNAKGYDVERSSGNGAAFTKIGYVAANNNGKYSSIDLSPLNSANYYRLKMTDLDGKFKYSEVRTVLFNGSAVLFDIYPNPVVSNNLNLHLQQYNYAGKAQAIITDIAGRSIQTSTINVVKGNNQIPLTVKNLNSGSYFVTVYDASGIVITETKKLVKQ